MADAAAIRRSMQWAHQRNANAHAEISRAQSEIASCEARIAQLQRELQELNGFRRKSANDLNTMRSQADRRRALYASVESIQNVSAFMSFSKVMKDAVDLRTKRSINTARDELTRQIDSAAASINREIADLQARIASLQRVIWNNQSAIARNNNDIARLSRELASAE